MNKKNTAIIFFTMALCLAFLIPSASAGGRWHQSGFVVVSGGYAQPHFFSNFVFTWPPNHGSYYYPHHPSYHRHIYHRSPPRKHRDYRGKRGGPHR